MANSDNVRRELQAFNLGETKPTFGNLLTLPVGDGLMYVQPVYAVRQLSDSSYPILQFVIVSYGGQVGIGNTLVEALGDVLGVDPTTTPSDPPPDNTGNGGNNGEDPPDKGTKAEQIAALLGQAQTAFDEADAAFRRGDTVTWAEKNQQARRLIERAIALSEDGPPSAPEE